MRKIITLSFLASALGVAGLLGASQQVAPKEARDARIIVSFKNYSSSMTNAQVLNYQNYDLDLIRDQVTSNFKIENRYTTLLNAVLMNVPASKVNDIRNLSFVDHVDYDTLHHIEDKDGITIYRKGVTRGVAEDENISATTMNVPANTKEGEGTLVGILDSGFLVNHKHTDGKTYTHETFTELASGVATKLSKADVDGLTGLNAEKKTVDSLYFNNKVPFYFDYGGDVDKYDDYGKVFTTDNDVFSDLSDHGLHVASMAAGNGPYKGIAPKAQIALFKVFTEYHPNSDEKKKYNAWKIIYTI